MRVSKTRSRMESEPAQTINMTMASGPCIELTHDFWRKLLENANSTPFPAFSTLSSTSGSQGQSCYTLPPITKSSSSHEPTTLIKAAWALVVCRYSDTGDVTFGSADFWPLEPSEPRVRPPINLIPMRVKPEYSATLEAYLSMVHALEEKTERHSRIPLDDIRRLSIHARGACEFQNAILFAQGAQTISDALVHVSHSDVLKSCPLLLVCTADDDSITLGIACNDSRISSKQAERILRQVEHVLLKLLSPPQTLSVKDVTLLSSGDVAEILHWNRRVPEYIDKCVHHVISEQALRRPGEDAVCSWDGDFKYRTLDRLSTRLAYHLRALGISCEDTVPLLFEKSKWHVVAMLGVMKAGAAFVPMDPSYPPSRLREIIAQLRPKIVLTSAQNAEIDLGEVTTFQLTSEAVGKLPENGNVSEDVQPHNAIYIVFTSGSSGKPKGVVVEHGALCSKSNPRTEALGRSKFSRVLQFASFSFDLSIEDILTTMMFGGCVCIPSESDRVNDLDGVINRMGVTCAHITPSLASTLIPGKLPSLRQLRLGGEAMTAYHLSQWAQKLDLRNAYGPTECTITAAISQPLKLEGDPTNIGHAVACHAWIVDADDHDRLSPIGCIGELLIEGPILARGYLHNPVKTAESFIVNPRWATDECTAGQKQHERRFYKTGDLVHYASDGSLKYMGRKDSQCKLRGQRIELGEVESHLKDGICDVEDVAAEVAQSSPDPADTFLVAFVALGRRYHDGDETALRISPSTKAEVAELARSTMERLRMSVPSYMIPSIFLPMKALPRTISGKTDRKMLRNLASSLDLAKLSSILV